MGKIWTLKDLDTKFNIKQTKRNYAEALVYLSYIGIIPKELLPSFLDKITELASQKTIEGQKEFDEDVINVLNKYEEILDIEERFFDCPECGGWMMIKVYDEINNRILLECWNTLEDGSICMANREVKPGEK